MRGGEQPDRGGRKVESGMEGNVTVPPLQCYFAEFGPLHVCRGASVPIGENLAHPADGVVS